MSGYQLPRLYSGAWGAGSAALEQYLKLLKEGELQNLEDKLREHLERARPDVQEGTRIQIRVVEQYALLIERWLPGEGIWAELDQVSFNFNKIKDVADYLEAHRIRRGLYTGKLEGDIYTCIFVGPPDSILRH